MDETRRQRYLDKLALLELRARQVHGWTRDADASRLQADPKTQLALYKALQEIVEAATDVCAMRVKDLGLAVKDDYRNADTLHDRGELSPEVAAALRQGNGLRNRLVHAYDDIRDELVLAFVRGGLEPLLRLTAEARRWL